MYSTSHHPMARAEQSRALHCRPGCSCCKPRATAAQLRRKDRRQARQALRNGQEV